MFTVFGASGNTGSVVASRLLERGKHVRIMVRDPLKVAALRAQGAEVVTGDLTDAKAVAAALAGAEGAYLLVPPDNGSPDLIGRARTIIAAYVAGLTAGAVPHAAVLSSVGAQHASGTGPIVTAHLEEQELPAAKGTTFTFVRAASFMENILANAQVMKQQGVLPVFGGGEDHPFTMVATRDIGEVAADALLDPPAETRWIELSGPREYSYRDAAAEASAILGRAVKPEPLPLDAMVPTLTQLGISANVASLLREMTEASRRGVIHFEGKGRALRGKRTLGEVLRAGLA